MNDALLKFNISKEFEAFKVDCQSTFQKGVTAIFGPSGSGKTTLLNCIAGFTVPDRGEIQLLGQTIYSSQEKVNVSPENRRIGYVFQDNLLFPHMTVRENISYGYKLTPSSRREIHPDDIAQLFQLTQLMDRSVKNLSGGERQRVSLARALATSPDVLLLDEPLSSLNTELRAVILKYLKQIVRELRTPMIYVSHSLSEIVAIAENVLVLTDGNKVAHGKVPGILAHEHVSKTTRYSSLENILEATVISINDQEGLCKLKVGNTHIYAPNFNLESGSTVMASIKAGDIIVTLDPPGRISARNVLTAVIEDIKETTSGILLYLDAGVRLIVTVTFGAFNEIELKKGVDVFLVFKSNSITVMDAID